MPKSFKYYSCHAKTTTLGDGWQRQQWWWPVEMATAIANGDKEGNGWRQGRRQWQRLTARQKRRWRWWATATAIAMANGDGNRNRLPRCWQRQWRQQWQRRRRRRSQWRWPRRWQQWQREGCFFMCRQCAVLWQGQHLASTPMDTLHSPALRHGGDTAKSVCSFSKGRVPDSSPWIVFSLFFTTTVQFTEQPSVHPPHYSGTQETCQPIEDLPPPLLQEPCQPIENLPRLLLHLFITASPSRACNDYNITFLCWCEMTNLSSTFFISQNFPLSLTEHTKFIWKHSVVIVETFKVRRSHVAKWLSDVLSNRSPGFETSAWRT